MIFAIAFFALGFAVALLGTPWSIALSRRGIGLDEANENRKRHSGSVSRIGGVPLLLSLGVCFLVILVLDHEKEPNWMPIVVGSVLMFALGFLDDLRPIGARKKLLGQIAIAVIAFSLGLGVDKVTYPGGAWNVELGGWSILVTVFWLIAIPNIVNLIDGFDGLASGLGIFMAVTLGIVALLSEQVAVAWYAFSLAGALLGFLVFNFPPAKIFLGDGGAYLIGFSIAALSITSSHKGSVAAVLLVTVVALGVPIIDTSFALMRRAVRGFPLFHADDEHIHHRLENLGFSKRRIVLGIYGVCVVLSLVGLSIFWSQGRTIPIAIGVVFLLALFAMKYLRYVDDWATFRGQLNRTLRRRQNVQYALLQARLMEFEVERCSSAEEFWARLDEAMLRVGFLPPDRGSVEGVAISVKYNGDVPWTVFAPRDVGPAKQWERLAECFRPVYIKAVTKWRP